MRWRIGSDCRRGPPRRWPLAATLAVTGALHEDGLADTADGFGGGATREQKLAIMRDSRIGTYGVCALALSIAAARERGGGARRAGRGRGGADRGAHRRPRGDAAADVLCWPARADGLSYDAGQPAPAGAVAAAAIGLVALVAGLGFVHAIEAAVCVGDRRSR